MITIGIPTLNGPDRLRRCLESIHEAGHLRDARVLVCCDGSTPEDREQNKAVVHRMSSKIPVELLMNEGRLGIATSWNRLARHYGDADVIALLNDDIEVVPWWLDVLAYSLRENPALGMVGLNSYVGLTKNQHAALYPGVPEHVRVPRIDFNVAHLLGAGEILSTTGSAFGFRRSAFDEVGGFNENYFCFFEEVHFGAMLRRQSFLNVMASYPVLYHMGGATNSDVKNLDAQAHMARSKAIFEAFWGKSLSEVRREYAVRNQPPDDLRLREWNSTIGNWG